MPGTLARGPKILMDEGRPQPLLTLDRLPNGQLIARRADTCSEVHVRRCFPWTEPARFLSLCDADGEEFALVCDPADLNADSRKVLEDALAEAGFVFELRAVLEIEEEIELRQWRVQTAQGTRTFQTRLDDWPRRLPDGGLLIRDVCGDLYRLDDPARLDRRSRSLLWAFVD